MRDLLLGLKPKDFDVATNATPEQVHKVFRNSRIIGRRFQIVHVRFGREIIEVSTFRAQHNQQKSSDAGHVLDDNVFGSFESDAFRRDFTVNALYYCATDERVLDPTGQGLADLAGKQLRLIGAPATRFKEDPVRMLRAISFKSKLKNSSTITIIHNSTERGRAKLKIMIYVMCHCKQPKVMPIHGDS